LIHKGEGKEPVSGWKLICLLRNDDSGGENRERIKKLTLLKRVGVPQDLIGIVIHLASEESAYLTGQTVVFDGGVV
jgi:NAD(P)-dependent dehydrogenase (short-subunit alcohol dehydrogenase family)